MIPLLSESINLHSYCRSSQSFQARLELADYEAENLARLQKMFSRKWEYIFMQAEAQSKVSMEAIAEFRILVSFMLKWLTR
jgi:hypothetical protein